jgi:hypothetical protein
MTSMSEFMQLADANNPVEIFLISNQFVDGLLFTIIVMLIMFVVYITAKSQGVETISSMIGATFTGFVLSSLFFVMQWNNLPGVPIAVPIIMLTLTATFIGLKIWKGE